VFVDHQVNPYDAFPQKEVKDVIRADFARALGRPSITDREVAQEIMSNPRIRYAFVLSNYLYQSAREAAPEPKDKIAPAIAKLDSLRIYNTRRYSEYGPTFSNPFHAIQDARSYLGDMIVAAEEAVAAGAVPKAAVAQILSLAKTWNAKYANFPSEAWKKQYEAADAKGKSDSATALRRQHSDMLAALATDISSIMKLELLLNNPEYRAASATPGSAAYLKARSVADGAEKDFSIRYGVPGMTFGLYPALPGGIADEGVQSISPSAFTVLDPYDRQVVSTAIDFESEAYLKLISEAPKDQDGQQQLPAEDDHWKARQSDSGAAKKAAYEAELQFVTLVSSLRDAPAFGSTAVKATLATGGLAPVIAMQTPLLAATASKDLTEAPITPTWVIPSDPTRFSDSFDYHESITTFPLGKLYVETARQRTASQEKEWPMVLRQLDTNPVQYGKPYLDSLKQQKIPADALAKASAEYAALGKSVQKIMQDSGLPAGKPVLTALEESSNAALADPKLTNQQKLQRLNDLSLTLLRVRIVELESRLAGVRVIDGAPVSELAGTPAQQQNDVNRLTVVSARKWLAEAKKLEADLTKNHSQDLTSNRVTAMSGIKMVEDAIFTISEDNKPFTQIKWTPAQTNVKAYHLTKDSMEIQRERVKNILVGIPLTSVEVEFDNGTHQPLPDYENPLPLSKRPNLSYRWLYYSDPDNSGTWFVMNPNYDPNSTKAEERVAYLGKVVGNTVLKVRPRSSTPDLSMEYDLELHGGNPIVLFNITPGSTGKFTGVPDRSDSIKLEALNASEDKVTGSSFVPSGYTRWVGKKMWAAVFLHEPGKK
jgi:hypothetical protein